MYEPRRRVHNVAKELGIESREIVAKCRDEGVPKIDTHMSIVSPDIEALIRIWFGDDGDAAGRPAVLSPKG
jgi:hypothetical protein